MAVYAEQSTKVTESLASSQVEKMQYILEEVDGEWPSCWECCEQDSSGVLLLHGVREKFRLCGNCLVRGLSILEEGKNKAKGVQQ